MSDSNFRRVPLLDELRGLVILLMVFYHAAYDLVYIFGVNWPFFSSPLMALNSCSALSSRLKATTVW